MKALRRRTFGKTKERKHGNINSYDETPDAVCGGSGTST